MQEKLSTAVPGVRTPPIQYELPSRRAERVAFVAQCPYRGGEKYSISPIYQKSQNR